MRKRTRTRSFIDSPALLPCMLSCFNLRLNATSNGHQSLPPGTTPELIALRKRLVSIRRQSDDVLQLETGHVSRPATDLRRLSLDSSTTTTSSHQPQSGNVVRPNQDAIAVNVGVPKTGARASIFGVFDGHGRGGTAAASFIADSLIREGSRALGSLHCLGEKELNGLPGALRRACSRADMALRTHAKFDTYMSGTTATMCVIRDTEVTCANVGDSRIMLAGYGYAPPIALTHDHVPFRPDERARLERAGGRVERWSPLPGLDTGPPRVYLPSTRIPGLAVSRAFGDLCLDGIISCKPDITRINVDRNHSFIVLASDGLWSMMSMDHVNDFVSRRRNQAAQKVVEMLVEHTVELWYQAGETHSDDISIVLIYLQWDH